MLPIDGGGLSRTKAKSRYEVPSTMPELKTRRKEKRPRSHHQGLSHDNICGSDQHMVRGRTTKKAPPGLVLGLRLPGVIECGSGVEFISNGRLGFGAVHYVACGDECRNRAKERRTARLPSVNPKPCRWRLRVRRSWLVWGRRQARIGDGCHTPIGIAQVPDKDQALAKSGTLPALSIFLPTGYHGASAAGVTHRLDCAHLRRGPGWPCCGNPRALRSARRRDSSRLYRARA